MLSISSWRSRCSSAASASALSSACLISRASRVSLAALDCRQYKHKNNRIPVEESFALPTTDTSYIELLCSSQRSYSKLKCHVSHSTAWSNFKLSRKAQLHTVLQLAVTAALASSAPLRCALKYEHRVQPPESVLP